MSSLRQPDGVNVWAREPFEDWIMAYYQVPKDLQLPHFLLGLL